jgi:hypothetical protein
LALADARAARGQAEFSAPPAAPRPDAVVESGEPDRPDGKGKESCAPSRRTDAAE